MNAKHLMDCYGHHAIEIDGERGEPSLYESPAALTTKDGKMFIAITAYYEGTLPTEKVFQLIPLETKRAETPECNLFQPEDACEHGALMSARLRALKGLASS